MVNAIASSHSQPKGVREGRAALLTAKATDSTRDRKGVLDLPGVSGGGTSGKNSAERERPYLVAGSGKDRAYKAEAEGARSQEGVREAHSTKEGVQDNALEGRSLTLIRLDRR